MYVKVHEQVNVHVQVQVYGKVHVARGRVTCTRWRGALQRGVRAMRRVMVRDGTILVG